MDALSREIIRDITRALSSLLRGEHPQSMSLGNADVEELQELCAVTDEFLKSFGEAQDFIAAVAQGNLETPVPVRNLLVSHFKDLHSTLRHLTWQTEQISKGYLHQQVDFLGDFSRAYNSMLASMREKKVVEDALHESERLLSNVFSSIQDGISILDNSLNIVRTNAVIEESHSEALPLVGKKCFEIFRGRTEPCETCPCLEALETGEAAYEVVELTGPEGDARGWIDLHAYPLVDSSTGQINGVIEYIRDITERKMAEDQVRASLKEKEVLLREIHHRVKNNLAVIDALVILQSNYTAGKPTDEAFQSIRTRIRSMALAHEMLYQSENLAYLNVPTYVGMLVNHLFLSGEHQGNKIRIEKEVENVSFGLDTGWPLGFILAELVSNCLKHAFPHRKGGEIRVSLRSTGDREFELVVKDNGVGLPEGVCVNNPKSLGLNLVVTFVKQLHGEIEMRRDSGTEVRIRFKEIKPKVSI